MSQKPRLPFTTKESWNLPSERSFVAGTAAFILACLIFAVFQWGETETVSSQGDIDESAQRPSPRSSPDLIDPAALASNPSRWTPKIPPYSDEGAYGYLSGYRETVSMRNPESGLRNSIAKGQKLYASNCQVCHGERGASTANLRIPARDLSNPIGYQYGSSDAAIYRSIAYGVPRAPGMGSFKGVLNETEIWAIVNHIKTLHRD